MNWLSLVLAPLAGYVLGSIPFGYLAGKAAGVDVRTFGSGRTGGTNVWRATGKVWPLVVTVLADAGKGMAAVFLARYLLHSELAAGLAGAGAVFGHNWSVFLGWRGGAGGMTAGAALLALSPLAGAIVIPLALIALFLSRYASVGTLTAGAGSLVVLAVLAVLRGQYNPPVHVIYGVLVTLGVAWSLRPNLKRIIQGTERRISFGHR